MPAPQKIIQLVERFDNNIKSYRNSAYNETQARQEYINPFFKSLGWDVDNEQGLAEAYKDVIHEDIVKIGTATKSPDYSFRVGGTRKFFVEAKKPSVDIETNVQPAYQLRRYAWSAKLPLSILTDFEEFAVYDCRLKPSLDDKPSTSRIMLLKFNDYVDKWDSIYEIFSKDAILKGGYDKFAETSKGKRGTSEVDDEFLKEIEGWRDILAKNIAIRNAMLTNRELNTIVQNTIDRLIFLRICEDRAIEEYGQLQTMLNGTNVYRRIVEIYYKADQKYNSGLFHFFDEKNREAPDTISTKIEIDDKPLKDIIKRLYYPESPYEFSVIPVEILGNVYERFLGKVIRLTAGHQAKIEEKPEVRKAGGVYYTPKYIVDYIVENTVGKLLNGESGLGNGCWGMENGDNDKNLKINDEVNIGKKDNELQRPGGLEGSNETGDGDLQAHQRIPKGRNVRSDKPGETLGNLDTIEHSGGSLPETHEGISEFHLDSDGFSVGVGNSDANLCKSSIYKSESTGKNLKSNSNYRKTVDKSQQSTKQKASSPQSLTPIPHSLTIEEASKLRICDPACGSGSFLLGAYRYLLDWHLNKYIENPDKFTKGKNPTIYQTKEHEYRLTIQEKKRILLNNIYGVDIDAQAVEVTKLSLLLKALEGETDQTLKSLELFHERALPDLSNNIKCGNSLIGPDFYDGKEQLFDIEEQIKVNAFDWEKEFPEVFGKIGNRGQGLGTGKANPQLPVPNSRKGFDAVIGNPPYLAFHEGFEDIKIYFKNFYKSAIGKYDQYILFVEKSLNLLKKDGIFSFIIPNKFIHSNYGLGIKNIILLHQIIEITDFNDLRVFTNATNYPCILVIKKSSPKSTFNYNSVLDLKNLSTNVIKIDQTILKNEGWTLVDNFEIKILEKMKLKGIALKNLSNNITQGLRTGELDVFFNNIDNDFISSRNIERELIKPIYHGKNIKRYVTLLQANKDYILFPYESDYKTPVNIKKYPNCNNYLKEYTVKLGERKDSGKIFKNTNKVWFEYWDSKPICFKSPKLVFPDISKTNNFFLDEDGIGYLNTCYAIFLKDNINYKYVLGILNSRLLEFYLHKISPFVRGGFYRYKTQYVEQLPIPIPQSPSPNHDHIVSLVEQMLELNKKVRTLQGHEKTVVERQIESTDRQIDKLVYELYSLTEEEIKVVEGET